MKYLLRKTVHGGDVWYVREVSDAGDVVWTGERKLADVFGSAEHARTERARAFLSRRDVTVVRLVPKPDVTPATKEDVRAAFDATRESLLALTRRLGDAQRMAANERFHVVNWVMESKDVVLSDLNEDQRRAIAGHLVAKYHLPPEMR